MLNDSFIVSIGERSSKSGGGTWPKARVSTGTHHQRRDDDDDDDDDDRRRRRDTIALSRDDIP